MRLNLLAPMGANPNFTVQTTFPMRFDVATSGLVSFAHSGITRNTMLAAAHTAAQPMSPPGAHRPYPKATLDAVAAEVQLHQSSIDLNADKVHQFKNAQRLLGFGAGVTGVWLGVTQLLGLGGSLLGASGGTLVFASAGVVHLMVVGAVVTSMLVGLLATVIVLQLMIRAKESQNVGAQHYIDNLEFKAAQGELGHLAA